MAYNALQDLGLSYQSKLLCSRHGLPCFAP
ncbi:Uncharacterised protein [Vibrio cholerae]|nr:Uncharacterised protein [Vibrio cholerae]